MSKAISSNITHPLLKWLNVKTMQKTIGIATINEPKNHAAPNWDPKKYSLINRSNNSMIGNCKYSLCHQYKIAGIKTIIQKIYNKLIRFSKCSNNFHFSFPVLALLKLLKKK